MKKVYPYACAVHPLYVATHKTLATNGGSATHNFVNIVRDKACVRARLSAVFSFGGGVAAGHLWRGAARSCTPCQNVCSRSLYRCAPLPHLRLPPKPPTTTLRGSTC